MNVRLVGTLTLLNLIRAAARPYCIVSAVVYATLLCTWRKLWIGCLTSGVRRCCAVSAPYVRLIEACMVTEFETFIVLSNLGFCVIGLAVKYLYFLK
jgi:hypothetical protein